MSALVPVTALFWVLEDAVVERILKHHIHTTQRHILVAATLEVQFKLEPLVYLSPTPLFIRYFLEYLFNNGCAYRVDHCVTFFIGMFLVVVANWRDSGAQSHFTPRPQTALHIYSSVIVFELRLRAEYHEQKLFVRIISEALAVGANLLK